MQYREAVLLVREDRGEEEEGVRVFTSLLEENDEQSPLMIERRECVEETT